MTQRKGSAASTSAVVLALVALAVAVYGVYHHREVAPQTAAAAEQNDMLRRLTGVDNQQVQNTLDARYRDADGDLVADPPADAKQRVNPTTLTFSYVVSEEADAFPAAFKALTDALSKATGKPVEFVKFDSYEDELRAIRDGTLHVAGLNTGSVPIGVCTAGFVPVVQLADANGTAGYHMRIIAGADSPIKTLKDLAGHELTLTELSSNSGYKAPLVVLRENGLRPGNDYLLRYSQGHPQSIEGVKAKRFEAAAVAGDVLKRLESDGRIAAADYRVIYTSDQMFPGAAIGYSSRLSLDLAAKIKGALTGFELKGTGLETLFAAEGKSKFVPVDYKKDWAFVRRIDESIGFGYVLRDPKPATSRPTTQTAVTLDDLRVQVIQVQLELDKQRRASRPPPPGDPFYGVAILIPTK